MQASVLLSLKVSKEEVYDINLDIPTSAPTADKPFLFEVNQTKLDSQGKRIEDEGSKDTVLKVAVGGESQAYIAVAPPQSLLETAKVSDYVDNLQVVVENGKYDQKNNKFIVSNDVPKVNE